MDCSALLPWGEGAVKHRWRAAIAVTFAVSTCSITHAQLLRPTLVGSAHDLEGAGAYTSYFTAGTAVGIIEFDIRSVTSAHKATLEFVPDVVRTPDRQHPAHFHLRIYPGGGPVSAEDQFLRREERAFAETDVVVSSTSAPAMVDVTEAVRTALQLEVSYLGFSFHGADDCDLGACPSGQIAVFGEHAEDGTAYNNFLLRIEPRTGDPLRIVRSWPQDGYVDVRDDFLANGKTNMGGRRGVEAVTISFNQPVRDAATGGALLPESFVVTESGQTRSRRVIKVTAAGVAPAGDGVDFTVHLDRSIEPGMWTTIRANVVDESGGPIRADADSITIGFLPGDVDRSGMTGAADVLYLLDILNGVAASASGPLACDIDRNEVCDESDIGRLFDLLNGVGSTRRWLNVVLAPKP